MKVSFVVLEPESKRGTYEVSLPVVVGRGSEARFRIQQDQISRKHCELFDRDGDVYVRDLGSTNGTFLDGEQIAASIRTPVPHGSVLRVGTIEIRIDHRDELGRLAAAAVPTPAVEQNATSEEFPEPAVEAAPSAGVTEPIETEEPIDAEMVVETENSPEPGDFDAIEADQPADEAFDPAAFDPAALGGAVAESEPPADGSFDFLAGSKEEQPKADADLDDFFKGLK